MECTSEQCKRDLRKRLKILHGSVNVSSESSLSLDSDAHFFHPFNCASKKRKKAPCGSKRDHLAKLFEKKKLRDKSLSKKLKTPFDRRLNRSCWPIELKKVTKIKKKPREKKREKPTYKSLPRHRFSNPIFFFSNQPTCLDSSQRTASDDSYSFEFVGQDLFENVFHIIKNKKHYLYEYVAPEMLMKVLHDPEYEKTGATIDMIIVKLRALNLDLNPIHEKLKGEIREKLLCAIKLGLVVENNGYYKIREEFRNEKLSKQKINAIWKLYYKRMKKSKTES